MKYATDFPIIFRSDGSMSLDMSRTITGPIVVLQRFLAKVLAKIGDYWWIPRAGTGLALKKGLSFDTTQLITMQSIVSAQASSDPQIDDQTVNLKFDTGTGVLRMDAWILVGTERFAPSISFSRNGVGIIVGAP